MALKQIDHPRLIICEGPSDAAFFRALCNGRVAVTGLFTVTFAPEMTDAAGNKLPGGIDAFGKALNGIIAVPGFDQLRSIVLAVDSDRDVPANFAKITTQIAGATTFGTPPTKRYAVPAAPLVASGSVPSVTVMFVPWVDQHGHLETLLLPAAMGPQNPATGHIGAYARDSGCDAWAEAHLRDEMRLRCLMAAGHRPDPFVSVSRLWEKAPALIPVTHGRFDQIAAFLAAIPS